MTTELRSLDAAALTRLGGLKTQCSASLLCTEHNAPHPCEACDALGLKSVACSACLYEFPEGLTDKGERACASPAVFAKTGRIAFESAAMEALAAEGVDKKSRRDQKKREKPAPAPAPTPAPAPAPAPVPKPPPKPAPDGPREEPPRKKPTREAPAPEPATPTRKEAETPTGEDTRPLDAKAIKAGESLARLAAWASFAAAVAGAYALWQQYLVDMSVGVLIAYVLTVLLIWFAGALPVLGKAPAHASMRGWAPLVWAFVHYAWPAAVGLAVACVLGTPGLGFFLSTLYGVAAIGLAVLAVMCLSHVGVALTMRAPWPQGAGLVQHFAGYKSAGMWVALMATLALNGVAVEGSDSLSAWITQPAPVKAGQPLLESAARKPDPNKDLRGFTRAALADIAQAVNEQRNLNAPAVTSALPKAEAAMGTLARLPRPPVGDKPAARALIVQANQLVQRRADWSEVADVYARAHAADRRDPTILVELATAHLRAGRHARAIEPVLEALRLDPKLSSAWMTLAELRLHASSGEPRLVQEAARYYVVAFWFARDRPSVVRRYTGKLKPRPGDPPHNIEAITIALQRLNS